MDNRPIGLLDSGVGGLTVVKQVLQQLPHENLVFIGDQARLPYGTRSTNEIITFTRQLCNFLIKQKVKMIVIACNTATAAALPSLRTEFTIPIIGVIAAGSQAAVKATQNQHVGVIATPATIKSQAYSQAIQQLNSQITVTGLAAPEFVTLVENNQYRSHLAIQVVQQTLAPLAQTDIDTLVLGCTHFPLLRPLIQHSLGNAIQLVDAGAATVDLLAAQLREKHLLSASLKNTYRFYTTGDTHNFLEIANDWLMPLKISAQHIDVTDLEG